MTHHGRTRGRDGRRATGLVLVLFGFCGAGLVAIGIALGFASPRVAAADPGGPGVLAPKAGGALARVLAGAELVPEMSTLTSRTYRRSDGSFVSRVFAQAPSFRDDQGTERLVDATLRPVMGGFRTAATPATTTFPSSLAKPVRVERDGSWLSMQLLGATGVGRASGSTMSYSGALPNTDAIYRVSAGAVGEDLHLTGLGAPSVFRFEIRASEGMTAEKLANGSIVFKRSGKRMLALAPSYAYPDGGGHMEQRVDTDLQLISDGWRLTLSVDDRWLRNALQQGPVTIDPTVQIDGAARDCPLSADLPNTSYCSSGQLWVGYNGNHDHHSMIKWDVSGVPRDAVALSANVALEEENTGPNATKQLTLHRMTRDWTSDASWNKYDATHAWTTPGGDFDPAPAATATVSALHTGSVDWSATGLVQHWIDGSLPNYGLVVKDKDGPLIAGEHDFASTSGADPGDAPELDIVWAPRTGALDSYSFESQALDAKTKADVNIANGNLLLSTQDLNVPGTGLDLRLDHYHNSLASSSELQSVGIRGTASLGRDLYLRVYDPSTIAFLRGDGVALPFTNPQTAGTLTTYDAPADLGPATLTRDTTTGTYALRLPGGLPSLPGVDVTLTFAATGRLLNLKNPAGNQISLSYYTDGGSLIPSINKITDTNGAQYPVIRTAVGDSYVKDIADPAGRHWRYVYGHYDTDFLTTYTAGDNTITRYAYDTSNRLTTVTTPDTNVTRITYTGSTSRVASVIRTNTTAHTTGPTTTFAYSAPTAPCLAGSNDFTKTVVTRPNASRTTYCANSHAQISYDTDPPTATPSGPWYDLRDGYTNGTDPSSITLTATDAAAGIKRMALEEVGGAELAVATLPCDPRNTALPTACPHIVANTLGFSAAALAEGRHSFRETARDYAGNSAASLPWVVSVDRTAPVFEGGLALEATLNPDGTATVEWAAATDPDLADGSSPSETGGYRYRYHSGSGAWTAIATTDVPVFSLPAAQASQPYTVDVAPVDGAGNVGGSATATVTPTTATGAAACDPAATVGAFICPGQDASTPMVDSDNEEDGTVSLIPDNTSSSRQQSAAASAGTLFTVRVSGGKYATVRNRWKSYVMGSVTDGDRLEAVAHHDVTIGSGAQLRYYWGTIKSTIFDNRRAGQCGWISTQVTGSPAAAATSTCPNTEPADTWDVDGFGKRRNCRPSPNCTAGTPVFMTKATPECSNVGLTPSGNADHCRDRVRYIGNTATAGNPSWVHYCVEWRYVTNDKKYVLVKDRHHSDPNGSWVFIHRDALVAGDANLPNKYAPERDTSCTQYEKDH